MAYEFGWKKINPVTVGASAIASELMEAVITAERGSLMQTNKPASLPASQEPRCADCKNHKATLTFSQGAMDYIHGGCKRICRCCYLKIVEQALTEVQANAEKLRNEVSENGCA